MTDFNDFVYMQIYRGSLRKGASESKALRAALLGLDDYKKNRFTKVSKLIEEKISLARRGLI